MKRLIIPILWMQMVLDNVHRTRHVGITLKWCGAQPLMWVAQWHTVPFFLRSPRLLFPVDHSWFVTMVKLGTIEVNFPTQTTRKGNSYLCNRHEEQEDLCRMVMALDYTFQYNYIHSFITNSLTFTHKAPPFHIVALLVVGSIRLLGILSFCFFIVRVVETAYKRCSPLWAVSLLSI